MNAEGTIFAVSEDEIFFIFRVILLNNLKVFFV